MPLDHLRLSPAWLSRVLTVPPPNVSVIVGLVFGPCNKSLRSPHRTATHRTAARNASKRKRTAPDKPPPPAPHCLASPPKRRSGSQGSLPHSLRSAGHQFLGGDCASEMRRWTSLLPNLESFLSYVFRRCNVTVRWRSRNLFRSPFHLCLYLFLCLFYYRSLRTICLCLFTKLGSHPSCT